MYNVDSNSDKKEEGEFDDMDLSCNKLSIQLLANDSNICSKKRHVIVDKDDEIEKFPKSKTTQEKKPPIKNVRIKSGKTSVPISGLVSCPSPDIQGIHMNTNIVILALNLFQILTKFQEETRQWRIIPQRTYK